MVRMGDNIGNDVYDFFNGVWKDAATEKNIVVEYLILKFRVIMKLFWLLIYMGMLFLLNTVPPYVIFKCIFKFK